MYKINSDAMGRMLESALRFLKDRSDDLLGLAVQMREANPASGDEKINKEFQKTLNCWNECRRIQFLIAVQASTPRLSSDDVYFVQQAHALAASPEPECMEAAREFLRKAEMVAPAMDIGAPSPPGPDDATVSARDIWIHRRSNEFYRVEKVTQGGNVMSRRTQDNEPSIYPMADFLSLHLKYKGADSDV